MRIKRVHLYVEKYSKHEQELLLDFVREDEFIYFRHRGDYIPGMHFRVDQYEPTMLLIHGCMPKRKIHEGIILTVNMEDLLALDKPSGHFSLNLEERNYLKPATVYLETNDGSAFTKLIDDPSTYVIKKVPKGLLYQPESTWNGPPCALHHLDHRFELRIWDVGQGNTNSISDYNNLTLFDFGASIYYSKNRCKDIIRSHAHILEDKDRISLIISHWDSDHINLLCEVDDTFLQKICCVFYPPNVVTLTARQIAARIERNCEYRVVIYPLPRAVRSRCGIRPMYSGSTYTLYTGETSKEQNLSGLLLALKSKKASAMLTADHSNYQVWDRLYTSVATTGKTIHVVVPHHGGSCGKTAVQTPSLPGSAVISVGTNGYGHPTPSTLAAYRYANYNVMRTDRHGQDIVILMQ